MITIDNKGGGFTTHRGNRIIIYFSEANVISNSDCGYASYLGIRIICAI